MDIERHKSMAGLVGLVVLFILVAQRVMSPATEISPDSYRYIDMGLNLAEHGTLTGQHFSPDTAPEPGLGAGGVFTAFEVALASIVSDTTRDSLVCLAANNADGGRAACPLDIPALKVIYSLEIFVFHVSVFFVGRLVFGGNAMALLTVALSLAFKDTRAFANSVLTEPSYMMAAALFLLSWLYAWKNPRRATAWFLCGAVLGLTVLIKPAWAALIPVMGVGAAAFILWARDKGFALRAAAALAVGAAVVLTPLLVRNVVQLGLWGLSDPAYLGASLAHRAGFNAMTWGEWAKGWIYYLPDFGDRAAYALFGPEIVDKLSWGADSFYVHGRDVLHAEAVAATSREGAGSYILKTYFLNDPAKAAAVTGLLLWRGLFVGRLMGLMALVLAAPILRFSPEKTRRNIAILALPILAMAGVHALVSVSIDRYNIALVIPYALILAQFLRLLGGWIAGMMPQRLTATAKTFFPRKG